MTERTSTREKYSEASCRSSQQSTLLQCTPTVSSLYRIFAYIPSIHI